MERVAFNSATECHFPAAEFAEHHTREEPPAAICEQLTASQVAEALTKIVHAFNKPGVFLELAVISERFGEILDVYDAVAETGIRDELNLLNLSILESLGLVRYVVLKFMTAPRSDVITTSNTFLASLSAA